jgi:hypothetical protein
MAAGHDQLLLMSAFPSSRQVNLWLCCKRLLCAIAGRAGDAAVETTVDHTLMRGRNRMIGDASWSCLGLETCVGSVIRQIVVARLVLTAAVPPALPVGAWRAIAAVTTLAGRVRVLGAEGRDSTTPIRCGLGSARSARRAAAPPRRSRRRSAARCSRARLAASRRSVLTRSPARLEISDGASTTHSCPLTLDAIAARASLIAEPQLHPLRRRAAYQTVQRRRRVRDPTRFSNLAAEAALGHRDNEALLVNMEPDLARMMQKGWRM